MHRWILLAAAVLVLPAAGGASNVRSAACPRGALALTANSVAPATRAAFAREKPSSRPQVTGAMLAKNDTERGPQAGRECGPKARARTVVVYIDLRAFHPSASLSERVSFVARFRGGYRVWEIVH